MSSDHERAARACAEEINEKYVLDLAPSGVQHLAKLIGFHFPAEAPREGAGEDRCPKCGALKFDLSASTEACDQCDWTSDQPQPPARAEEPRGCPTPGACSALEVMADRDRLAARERQAREALRDTVAVDQERIAALEAELEKVREQVRCSHPSRLDDVRQLQQERDAARAEAGALRDTLADFAELVKSRMESGGWNDDDAELVRSMHEKLPSPTQEPAE